MEHTVRSQFQRLEKLFNMIVFKKSTQLANYIIQLKSAGYKIGFVPTMGALHKGHLSLLESSLKGNDKTVCSIFINPTQFNDANDFRKYPVTVEKDLNLLEQSGVDIAFLPDVNEIYPDGTSHLQNFDLGDLEHVLEGAFRPNHFQGVCQVMYRLLSIVQPHNLYMGQKDYQQCMVVQKLLEIMKVDITLNICPTQREDDGLAMSSRNTRLNTEERTRAVTISRVLGFLKENLRPGDLTPLIKKGREMLDEKNFKTDYVQICDARTLEQVRYWDGKQRLVSLIASFVNDVRLIDNMILTG